MAESIAAKSRLLAFPPLASTSFPCFNLESCRNNIELGPALLAERYATPARRAMAFDKREFGVLKYSDVNAGRAALTTFLSFSATALTFGSCFPLTPQRFLLKL
jgi:hypothetical protein